MSTYLPACCPPRLDRRRPRSGASRFWCGAALVGMVLATDVRAGIVDFESEPLGKVYGNSTGFSPGDLALVQNNTRMHVDDFYFVPFPSGPIFLDAEIVAPPHIFAPTTSQGLATGNINALFDFSAYPGEVHKARLQYVDFGGNENFDINSLGPFSVDDLPLLPPIPGFHVTVTAAPLPFGGVGGTVVVEQTGPDPIKTLMIGGQEFGIDNVEAPFAGDLNGDGEINFGDLNGMTMALSDPARYAAHFPNLDRVTRCDTNFDRACNFGDINGFVDLLTGSPAAAAGLASAAVPEPSALTLLALAAGTSLASARRRPPAYLGPAAS